MKDINNQHIKMIQSLLNHCEEIEVAACRRIGTEDEVVIIRSWQPDGRQIKWLLYENARNQANIWVRPKPNVKHPWLFIDDLPLNMAVAIGRKYQAMIVETSPNNCQARLLSNLSLSRDERTLVQRNLVSMLKGNADAGSVAGCKWGRLPGFRNRKPGKDCWTNLISLPNASLRKFDPLPYLNISPHMGECASPILTNKATVSSDGTDQSSRDFGRVLGRLKYFSKNGCALQEEIVRLKSELILKSARKKSPADYAERTIAAALKLL